MMTKWLSLCFFVSATAWKARENFVGNRQVHNHILTDVGHYRGANGPDANTEKALLWTQDCCLGDQIVLKLRDEGHDGNEGTGLFTFNSTDGGRAEHIVRQFYGVAETYGPFCALAGWHTFDYSSDARPEETSFMILDSFGNLLKYGNMETTTFPIFFHTSSPSKFCDLEYLKLYPELKRRRAAKIARAVYDSRQIDGSFAPASTTCDSKGWCPNASHIKLHSDNIGTGGFKGQPNLYTDITGGYESGESYQHGIDHTLTSGTLDPDSSK